MSDSPHPALILVTPCVGPVATTGSEQAAGLPDGVVAGLVNHCILGHGDMRVSKIQVFRRDVQVFKKLPDDVVPHPKNGMGGKRQAITEFSPQSRFRLLHWVKNCEVDFKSMLTLTYPAEFPTNGRRVKGHFKALRKRLLRRFPQFRGIWWLEFQLRGAPHFHILSNIDLRDCGDLLELRRRDRVCYVNKEIWLWLSRAWFEIVASGDQKHLRAGSCWEVIDNEDGAIRYAAAHASKPKQKQVPEDFQNVGRFWGGIGIKMPTGRGIEASTYDVFDVVGLDAMSSRGRVKKYLWDKAVLYK